MARERTSVGVGDVACTFSLAVKPKQETLAHEKLIKKLRERLGVTRTDAERGIRLALTFAMIVRRGNRRYALL